MSIFSILRTLTHTASSHIDNLKFVSENFRYHCGYSVEQQMKLLKYIYFQKKRSIDQTYDIDHR